MSDQIYVSDVYGSFHVSGPGQEISKRKVIGIYVFLKYKIIDWGHISEEILSFEIFSVEI